jgi:hypothetical protein
MNDKDQNAKALRFEMDAMKQEQNALREEKEGVELSFAQEKMAWVQEKTEYEAKVEAGEASYAGKITELQTMMEGSAGLASLLLFLLMANLPHIDSTNYMISFGCFCVCLPATQYYNMLLYCSR